MSNRFNPRTSISSAGKAVSVSGLTTMVGFGSLLLARHVGIFSLGALLTLAIGCNLAAAFIVLPLVLYLFPLGATPTDSTGTPRRFAQMMSAITRRQQTTRRGSQGRPT